MIVASTARCGRKTSTYVYIQSDDDSTLQGEEKKRNLERAVQFSWEDLCNGLGGALSGMGV